MKKTLLLAMILLSSASLANETKKFPKGSSGGRFQIVQISDYRRDQYLIDTETGNIWSMVCASGAVDNCSYAAFTKIDVEGVNISRKEMMKKAAESDDYLAEKAKRATEQNKQKSDQ